MLHFVTPYMKQNKSRKQTLESAQYGLENSFKSRLEDLRMHDRLQSRNETLFCAEVDRDTGSEMTSSSRLEKLGLDWTRLVNTDLKYAKPKGPTSFPGPFPWLEVV